VDSACLGFGPVAGWCDETSGYSVTELVSHEVYTTSLCNVQTFYIVSVFKKFKVSAVLHVMQGLGRAIEEAVNSRLLTAAARIRSQVSPH
jgi:hypothetical protein